MDEETKPKAPPTAPPAPQVIAGRTGDGAGGRCHWCGYELQGLEAYGRCPECGTSYTPESAARLRPPPGAFVVCLRLAWPLLVLGLLMVPMARGTGDLGAMLGIYAMVVAVPINSYLQVRFMLKKHLPEQKRTGGFILGLRALGTLVAVLVLIITLLPLILLGACLVTEGLGL